MIASRRQRDREIRQACSQSKHGESNIIVATWNLNTLNGKMQEVLDTASRLGLQILCLQETRHDGRIMATIRAMAEAAGWQAYFSEPSVNSAGSAMHGCITMTRWPAEQIKIPEELHPDAVQRCVATRVFHSNFGYFNLCNCYVHVNDKPAARDMMAKVQEFLIGNNGEAMIIGDWNCTPCEQPAAKAISTGRWHLAVDSF